MKMVINEYILHEAIRLAKRKFDSHENPPDLFYVNFENRNGVPFNSLDLKGTEKFDENIVPSRFCLALKYVAKLELRTEWELDLVKTLEQNGYSVNKCES